MKSKAPRLRQLMLTGALVLGAGVGAAGIASAASTPTTSSPSTNVTAPSNAPTNPVNMTNGPGETLLTGADLTSATAAATAAVPGATVIRAESDSSGTGTYEVHLQKSDGTVETVYLDANFKVTSTTTGFGPCPNGAGPGVNPGNGGPSALTTSPSTTIG